MVKKDPKTVRIIKRILSVTLILILAAVIALQFPAVQTRLANKFLQRIQNSTDADLQIGSIHIVPFNVAIIEDVTLIDTDPCPTEGFCRPISPIDTIIHIDKVVTTFSLSGLMSSNGLHFGRANIYGLVFNLTAEDDGNRNNLARALHLPDPKDEPVDTPELFRIRRLSVHDSRYRMFLIRCKQAPYNGNGINWNDLDASLNLEAHSVMFAHGVMSATVDECQLEEKSGYRILSCNGKVRVGMGKTIVDDIHIIDPWSDIKAKTYQMHYPNSKAFKDFNHNIIIHSEISPSSVSWKSIRYFAAGSMWDNPCTCDVSGGVFDGSLSNFRVTGCKFREKGSGIHGTINGGVAGIGCTQPLEFTSDKTMLDFNMKGLGTFISEFAGVDVKLPDFSDKTVFKATLSTSGTLDALSFGAQIKTDDGTAVADGLIENILDEQDLRVSGAVSTSNLDLGELLGIKGIGKATLNTELSAKLSKKPSVAISSFESEQLELLGYTYSGIRLAGHFSSLNDFLIDMSVRDPNADFTVKGSTRDLCIDVRNADLSRLNIVKEREMFALSGRVSASMITDTDNSRELDIHTSDIKLTTPEGTGNSKRVSIRATDSDKFSEIRIDSDFLRANYRGTSKLSEILKSDGYASADLWSGNALLSILFPGLYVAMGTQAKASIDDGEMKASLVSERIALGKLYLKDTELQTRLKDKQYNMEFRYSGLSDICSGGSLNISGAIDGKELIARTNSSFISIGNDKWSVSDASILHRKGNTSIQNFTLSCADQFISVNGDVSLTDTESLEIILNKVNLGTANTLSKVDLGIGGTCSGKAVLMSPTKNQFRLAAGVACDELTLGGRNAGIIRLGSSWSDETQQLKLFLKHTLSGHESIDLRGCYTPHDESCDITARFDNTQAVLLEPLFKSVFKTVGGSLSGNVNASGPVRNPVITGNDLEINNLILQPLVTGVRYTINGGLELQDTELVFDSLNISDSENGKAVLTGKMSLQDLSDISLDSRMTLDALKLVDCPEEQAGIMYGKLAANGRIDVKGPLNALSIDANISTEGYGDVHVPVRNSANDANSTLLSFKAPVGEEDLYAKAMRLYDQSKPSVKSDMNIKARISVNEQVGAFVDIDKETGNVLYSYGHGTVDLNLRPSKEQFNLVGDYTISRGNYHFSIPGVIGKDFAIENGSSIKLGGDILDTELDINASYNLKTRLSTLISDTTSVASRRPVVCRLGISDKLRNPQLRFAIDVPDLDPITKAQVESALNTEDKIQKQFMALLLLGNFVPDDNSGVVHGGNILYSNVTEIMSRQINNILSKLNIPVDLGFGYQQNNGGTDVFDVAVSTQLFNNRVIVGGSVGNKKYSTSTNINGDVVGDLDIEIKLDKSGQFRFNLFSHAADEHTSFLDYSQRNGIGLTYQKEYNRFGDLIRDLFSSRKRKAQQALEEIKRNTEKVTIIIDE